VFVYAMLFMPVLRVLKKACKKRLFYGFSHPAIAADRAKPVRN